MRVTTSHWQLFLELAEQFPALITSKFNGPQGKAQGNELWKTVAARLNGLGYGEKTILEWRRALTDWKSKVKVKASKLRCSLTLTGGGSCDTPPLTGLEEKLLGLMGRKCLEGDEVKELGQCVPQMVEMSNESNLDFEIFAEPLAEADYFSEHNYSSLDIALPSKGKNILKRKFPADVSSPSTSKVPDNVPFIESTISNKHININMTHKGPGPIIKKNPISTPSRNIPLPSRNINESSMSSGAEQKRRKISAIPKIGKTLENMTADSLEIFKEIAKNTENISKNSTRIADSLEELVLYFKNS
ncbi:unnamed protein product [Psylliodes chrysocephalus]|uniref:Regulatory protein zeste n=1 Tax=Psylliodes chrysocephalus TaxID=3402493 RepID=A0A9P0CNJ9_9CUCU|nr:unnamed protein product [Psylliodes chrysocephala]